MSTQVQFPEMRAEVIDAIRSLADRDRQERYWIRQEFPSEGYFEDLGLKVNIIYDDTGVLREPSSRLGSILASDEEVTALRRLAEELNPIIDRLGDQPDAAYLQDPAWQNVIDRAASALSVIQREDQGSG